MGVCTHIRTHTYAHTNICSLGYTHTHTNKHPHTHTHMHTHTSIQKKDTHTHIQAYKKKIHTHTHIDTHAYTHTNKKQKGKIHPQNVMYTCVHIREKSVGWSGCKEESQSRKHNSNTNTKRADQQHSHSHTRTHTNTPITGTTRRGDSTPKRDTQPHRRHRQHPAQPNTHKSSIQTKGVLLLVLVLHGNNKGAAMCFSQCECFSCVEMSTESREQCEKSLSDKEKGPAHWCACNNMHTGRRS